MGHVIRAQFPDLHLVLQTPEWLKKIGSLIGEVVTVEWKATSYKRPASPIVNILVQQTDKLPATLVTPDVSWDTMKGTKIKQCIIYLGLSNQCNRCQKFGHNNIDCKLSCTAVPNLDVRDPPEVEGRTDKRKELLEHGSFTNVKRKRVRKSCN